MRKEMVSDPERPIGRFPVTIRFAQPVPLQKRSLLEKAALTCPVHHSLDPRIEIPLEWIFP